MPGMVAAGTVRARAQSITSSPASQPLTSPPLVEAKIVSRLPLGAAVSLPPLQASSSSPLHKLNASLQSSPTKMAPTSSLTRLQSSNIVADRLKWGEEKQTAVMASPRASPASRPTHTKRASVMERWGRDMPNVVEENSSSKGPSVSAASPWSSNVGSGANVADRWTEKEEATSGVKEEKAFSSPALVHVSWLRL
jgi:hypothetical protein